ncbi:MAG: GNAT family N-acetyltransferase [Sedimentisphaerales bacterium]|nr:GNAT family N-acetyltransferase [Sedimentisphaerales bacterium]
MAIPELECLLTSRISAERLRPEHEELIHRVHRDESVMAWLGGLRSLEETHDYMALNLAHWQSYGFGIWTLRETATERFMGRGGLRNAAIDGRPEVELAYGLLPEFWNRGLATEFARHLVQIGSDDLGFSDLVSVTRPENVASQRVLAKAGFQPERQTLFKGELHLLYRWRVDASAEPAR